MVNENLFYTNLRFRKDAVDVSGNTNVAIEAYITEQARLQLYTYIKKLTAARVLYMEAESCIFIWKKDDATEYTPLLGALFSSMTDELKSYGEGTYITNFFSGDPKFYGFRAVVISTRNQGIKGISLYSNNLCIINFESIGRFIAAYFKNHRKAIALKYDLSLTLSRAAKKSCFAILKKRT